MALLAPSLVALLPADLAVWVEARAPVEGVSPEALVIVALRDYAGLVDAAGTSRGDPVVVLGPPTIEQAIGALAAEAVDAAALLPLPTGPVPRMRSCPVNPAKRAAVLAIVTSLGPVGLRDVQAALTLRGHPLSNAMTCLTLSWLVQHGELRRVRHGVYARTADGPGLVELGPGRPSRGAPESPTNSHRAGDPDDADSLRVDGRAHAASGLPRGAARE